MYGRRELWPLLRPVQYAHNEDDVAANRVNHDVRQWREHKLVRAGSLSRTAAVRECQEDGWRLVDRSYEVRRPIGHVGKR